MALQTIKSIDYMNGLCAQFTIDFHSKFEELLLKD